MDAIAILGEHEGFERQSAPQFALERLYELLERCGPGQRLPSQREIADALAISRPSVREAIAVLHAIGLVEVRHGRGVYVTREPTLARVLRRVTSVLLREITIRELFDVRQTIELEVARLAALNASAEQRDDLVARAKAMREILDPVVFNQADVEFHLGIARASQNRLWVHMLDMVGSLLFRSFLESDLAAGPNMAQRIQRAAEQHVQIAAAIASGNPEGARVEMERHLAIHSDFLAEASDERVSLLPLATAVPSQRDGSEPAI